MTIERRPQWWLGSEESDIGLYLEELTNGTSERYTQSICSCSSTEFQVYFDREQGFVSRICTECLTEHLVCDSSDSQPDSSPHKFSCVQCGKTAANLGVGFALRPRKLTEIFGQNRDVRWIWVGLRCVGCGVLGCIADWKIDYAPSNFLVNQA